MSARLYNTWPLCDTTCSGIGGALRCTSPPIHSNTPNDRVSKVPKPSHSLRVVFMTAYSF